MPTKARRDNSYYRQRMKREAPTVYADYVAGKFQSFAAARRAAKLVSPRTRLHELKNAWTKATKAERDEFVLWIKSSRSLASRAAIDSAGRLTPWGKQQVKAIMDRRHLRMGDLLSELGLNRLNPSIGQALARDTRLAAAVATVLQRWISTHGTK
jgi:hypothetical protein